MASRYNVMDEGMVSQFETDLRQESGYEVVFQRLGDVLDAVSEDDLTEGDWERLEYYESRARATMRGDMAGDTWQEQMRKKWDAWQDQEPGPQEKPGQQSQHHDDSFTPADQPDPKQSTASPAGYWYARAREGRSRPVVTHTPGEEIITKVVGVTFEGRQQVVAQLSTGEPVWLTREPQNPYDANAIRVQRANGQQIGYINRALAAKLAPCFDRYGAAVPANVLNVTGGHDAFSNRGVDIGFQVPQPEPSDAGNHDDENAWRYHP